MAEHKPEYQPKDDEIDLGQLFKMIGNGFNRLGIFFLRAFVYLKKHALILLGLIVLGVAANFVLGTLIEKKLKTEVILKPNFESEDYLYDVIEEIQANIYSKDTNFFKSIGIDANDIYSFNIDIAPIEEEEQIKEKVEQEIEYLRLLQGFKEENFAVDIMKSELNKKSIAPHKITFTYIGAEKGKKVVEKLLQYINSNQYYNQLSNLFRQNAQLRIDQNLKLIGQIDNLVDNYSKYLLQKEVQNAPSVHMENESALDISALLALKNKMIKEIEEKKVELTDQAQAINVMNIGRPQVVKKPFFNDKSFLLPFGLVVLFLTVSFIRFLNKRAKELEL